MDWAGRPAAGYFTKRTAEAALRDLLDEARRTAALAGGAERVRVTSPEAAAEWLRFIAEDRGRKPSTLRDYCLVLNAYLLPAFRERELESTEPAEIER